MKAEYTLTTVCQLQYHAEVIFSRKPKIYKEIQTNSEENYNPFLPSLDNGSDTENRWR